MSDSVISHSLETEFQLALDSIKNRLEEQLSFETLLNEISARFINIPSHQVAATIEDTQRMLCERLDLDRSCLFQCMEETESTLLLTHLYQRPGLAVSLQKQKEPGSNAESYWTTTDSQRGSLKVDARQMFPWFYGKARRGETAIVPDVQALNGEAAVDMENLARIGTQSGVAVPLSIGGVWLGLLTFGSIRQRRDWPAGLVKRFEFLASVYSNALARARADEAIRDSEERYRRLFEAESDAILLADSETGKLLDVNAAALAMYGYSRQEFLNLHCNELSLEPARPMPVISSTENLLSTHWHRRKNAEAFPVEISASFLDHHGRKSFVLAIRDITERSTAQKRLEQSEQKFRQMAENIHEVFYNFDVQSRRLEYVSPMYEQICVRPCRTLYEDPAAFLQIVHPDDRERVLESAVNASRGEITTLEYRIVRPDGSIRWLWGRAFPILDKGGVTRVTGLAEDITERKEAESLLRESEARFRTVANSTPVLLWMSGTDKLCTFVNKSWLDFTGRAAEQEFGNGWAESVHPEDLAACLKTYYEAFDGRRPFTMEYRLRRHDGEYRWISDTGVPRHGTGGEFSGYIGSCLDTTERKEAESALRNSEERFRQIAGNVTDFIWEVDASGLLTYTSGSVERILGYHPEELIGKVRFHDLFVPEAHEKLKTTLLRVAARSWPLRGFPSESVCKDGRRVHLESSASPMLNAAGGLIGYRGATSDVTERKTAEAALHQSLAEIRDLKDRLHAETEYLRSEIKVTQSFGELIGQSPAIRHVMHQVEQVAPADCAVLITGETGTGKELIARAIHRLSSHRERAMVKVNCAALPSPLVESELFGRERGAFTGAMTTQAGRFEVADGSTIFLDEIGEVSLETQAKLLRVIQEGEFERLGSPRVRKVKVRVVAATNRDLAEAVRKGSFRQDLFYRLNVFPIKVPPLRDRAEDIPALVSAFVSEFATRLSKKITKLPRRTMTMLQAYSWPGNIRQLRNVLEHAVILSNDDVLRINPLTEPATEAKTGPTTLADSEREHILKTFEKTGGRIKGPRGAAELLGMNPATLYSRMRKLGISNRSQRGIVS